MKRECTQESSIVLSCTTSNVPYSKVEWGMYCEKRRRANTIWPHLGGNDQLDTNSAPAESSDTKINSLKHGHVRRCIVWLQMSCTLELRHRIIGATCRSISDWCNARATETSRQYRLIPIVSCSEFLRGSTESYPLEALTHGFDGSWLGNR